MTKSVLSLFSGAGGMDLGLEAAGFVSVGSIEIDPLPKTSLDLNRHWEHLGDGDINRVSRWLQPNDLGLEQGELDLLAGGPPCQPFSAAAQWARNGRQGLLDDRALTVAALLRVVENFLPRAILMENVVGFVKGRNSAADFLASELHRIGQKHGVDYKMHVRILNAADYGVAQNRRRAIIVVLRDGEDFSWPDPTHVGSHLTAWDALHDVSRDDLPPLRGKWADLLPSIPPGENYQWLTSKGGGDEVFGYRTRYWNFLLKLSPTQPSWTLSASPGPATGPFHWENRPLSVAEQKRIQGFPDDWNLAGDYRQQTKQVGNATPPPLAGVLGGRILEHLNGDPPLRLPLVRARAHRSPSIPPAVADVPHRYRDLVGAKPAHGGTGRGPAPRMSGGPVSRLQSAK